MADLTRPAGKLPVWGLFAASAHLLTRNIGWVVLFTILFAAIPAGVSALALLAIAPTMPQAVVVTIFLAIGMFLPMVIMAAQVHLLHDLATGVPIELRRSLKRGLWCILPFLGLSILLMILGGGLFLINATLGMLATNTAVLPGALSALTATLITIVVSVALVATTILLSAVVYPACIVERIGPIAAVERAVALLHGSVCRTVAALALLVLLWAIPAVLLALIFGTSDVDAHALEPSLPAAGAAAGFGLVAQAYMVCFLVTLYRQLRLREGDRSSPGRPPETVELAAA